MAFSKRLLACVLVPLFLGCALLVVTFGYPDDFRNLMASVGHAMEAKSSETVDAANRVEALLDEMS